MKILYYIEKDKHTIIVTTTKKFKINISFKKVINKLCLDNLSTLEGRMEAVKEKFAFKYNIPIYINNDIILMKVKLKHNYWINICSIKEIYKNSNKTDILFTEGIILSIDKKYELVKLIYNKTKVITDFIK